MVAVEVNLYNRDLYTVQCTALTSKSKIPFRMLRVCYICHIYTLFRIDLLCTSRAHSHFLQYGFFHP